MFYKCFTIGNIVRKHHCAQCDKKKCDIIIWYQRGGNMKKVLLLIISFSLVLAGCGSDDSAEVSVSETAGTVGTALSYEEFTISLDDAYYANFPHDGIDLNFDRYLAADVTIENSSNDAAVAKALMNFTIVDENDNLSRVMIDENKKKFSSNLMPGEEFEITVVFPVMNSDEYTLNYSYGATSNQEDVLSWTFSLENVKAKKVENTIEHRDVGDVVKTFLFGDGSKEIAFEGNPASESSEAKDEAKASEAKESNQTSEVKNNG